MDNKAVMLGVGGALVGLLCGTAIGGAVSSGKMEHAITRTLAPAQEQAGAQGAALQAALADLGARLEALETAVAEASVDPEAFAANVQSSVQAGSEGLAGKLDALQTSVGDLGVQIEAASAAQADALKTALSEMSQGMAESAQIAAAAVAVADGGEAAGLTGEGMELSTALRVGQTAVFADGAVRAFVSRLDEAGGAVRLTLNGSTTELGIGGTTAIDSGETTCTLAVMALTSEGVTLGSDCAGATGAPTGETTGSTAAPLTDPVKPGNTVRFADGALRAFVVAADVQSQTARVAVNGVTQTRLAVGESVEVPAGEQSCTLTLVGVEAGAVGLEGSCQ